MVKAAAIDAIKKRGQLPQYFHSDQGSEYQSEEHADYLAKLGVTISMSKKGSPWENGYQESFYSNFKLELQNTNRFETEGQLIENIYHQVYYYNNIRIKDSLKMPPTQYYFLTTKGLIMRTKVSEEMGACQLLIIRTCISSRFHLFYPIVHPKNFVLHLFAELQLNTSGV